VYLFGIECFPREQDIVGLDRKRSDAHREKPAIRRSDVPHTAWKRLDVPQKKEIAL
jgi:hypothetical protein